MAGLGFGQRAMGRRRRGGAGGPAGSWRLATVRAGETSYGAGGTSFASLRRNSFRQKDRLGPANYLRLKFVDSGFSVTTTNVEAALDPSPICQRAVEIGAQVRRVTWGGADSVTVPPGSAGIESDELLPGAFGLSSFAPASDIWLRSIVDAADLGGGTYGGYLQCPALGPGTPAGEGGYRTATSTDQLMATGVMAAGGTALTVITGAAQRVLGYASDHGPTVLVCGDSRFYGFQGDNGPGSATAGGPARIALEALGLPHEMQARSSTQLSQLVASGFANFARRMAGVAYVSDIICNHFVNDMGAGRTASQILADIAAFTAYCRSINPRVRIWWSNAAPRTNGSNVPSGLFVAGTANGRDAFNAALEGDPASLGISGVIDIRSVCEDPANPDRWLDFATKSPDGIHSSQAQQLLEAGRIQAVAAALPPPL